MLTPFTLRFHLPNLGVFAVFRTLSQPLHGRVDGHQGCVDLRDEISRWGEVVRDLANHVRDLASRAGEVRANPERLVYIETVNHHIHKPAERTKSARLI